VLIILLTGCVGFDAARELCFKLASRVGGPSDAIFLAWVAAGIFIWAIEIVTYSVVLSRLPLNVAFPVMSLTYAASLLVGRFVLGEPVSGQRWLGTGLITAGVILVGFSGIA
jgi:undecaprenyl phosphate-alpha-L-ara4N flippase subunit ArnE